MNFFFCFIFSIGIYIAGSFLDLSKSFAAEADVGSAVENSDESDEPGGVSKKSSTSENEERVKTDVEKFEITGSRIRQIDIENFYPIQSFDEDYFEQTGATTLGDALRESPFFLDGIEREHPLKDPGSQGGNVNARILINGLKTSYSDLASFPLGLIDRVDYLERGAVGNYGEEKVINIITKKNIEGVNFSINYDHPFERHGKRLQANIVGGFQINPQWNVTGGINYRWSQVLDDKDRDHSDPNYSSHGTGFPGTYQDLNDKWHAHPDCPEDGIQELPGGGSFCNINVTTFGTDLIPSNNQVGGLLNSVFRLSHNMTLYTEASISKRFSKRELAPMPLLTWRHFNRKLGENLEENQWDKLIEEDGGFTLPEGNGPWSGLKVKDFHHRLKGYNREMYENNLWYNAQSMLDLNFTDRWDGRVSLSWSQRLTDESVKGFVQAQPNPIHIIRDAKYRPFGDEGNRGTPPVNVDKVLKLEKVKSQYVLNLSSSYLLFDWPWAEGGPFLLSFSAENLYKQESLVNTEEGGKLIGSAAENEIETQQQTHFYNFQFVSQFLPIVDFTFSNGLQYDSVFEELNYLPQLGFRFKPSKRILFRGNLEYYKAVVGPAFKKSQKLGDGNPFIIDYLHCNPEKVVDEKTKNLYCTRPQLGAFVYGNPELKSPTHWKVHLGTYIQPLEGLSFNLNAWYENRKKLILTAESFTELLPRIQHEKGVEALDKFQAEVEIEKDDGTKETKKNRVKRDEHNAIEDFDFVYNNEVDRIKYGGNLNISFKLPMAILGGNLKVGQTLYFVLSNEIKIPKIDWKLQTLGLYGSPQWRSRSYIKWSTKLHEVNLVGHRVSSTKRFLESVEKGTYPLYMALDLDYKIKVSIGNRIKGHLGAGVKNIFDASPALDRNSGDPSKLYQSSIYDPRGRLVYLKYKQYF